MRSGSHSCQLGFDCNQRPWLSTPDSRCRLAKHYPRKNDANMKLPSSLYIVDQVTGHSRMGVPAFLHVLQHVHDIVAAQSQVPHEVFHRGR